MAVRTRLHPNLTSSVVPLWDLEQSHLLSAGCPSPGLEWQSPGYHTSLEGSTELLEITDSLAKFEALYKHRVVFTHPLHKAEEKSPSLELHLSSSKTIPSRSDTACVCALLINPHIWPASCVHGAGMGEGL